MDPASDLYLFSEIVRHGSFVAAARHLGMTPSGVSKRLSRFENRLETRLFNRTTRSLALTESGQELFQRSQSILEAIDEAESYARELTQTPRGQIRIACSDAFAMLVIVPMMQHLHTEYPDISVSLLQGDGPVDLLAENVDLAVRFEQPTNVGFVAKKLIDDPWVVVASPEYIDRYGEPDQPQDLLNHRCMTILARHQETNHWQFKGENQLVINSIFSGIGLVVRQAALSGLGIARLANFLIEADIQEGRLQPLLENFAPSSERAIYAVYPNREFLPQKVRVIIDALEQQLGQTAVRNVLNPSI